MIRRHMVVLVWLGLAISPAQADVITYLRFEEGSGSFTADQTGLMNGALDAFGDLSAGAGDSGPQGWSVNVASPVVPQSGAPNTGSLRYAGGGAYVNMSNANDVNLGTEFTVELFFNADQPSTISSIFGFSVGSELGIALTESLGNLYFNMAFQDQTPYTPATGVSTGVWYHLALVKVPSEYSLYIDGSLVANSPVASSADGPYSFFGTDVAGDRYIGGFRGYLDEFRISDTALTPDEFLIVPEPSTLVLLSLGLAGLCGRRFVRTRATGR